MSCDAAIRVSGVSKKYRLFTKPQDRLWEALHPWRKRLHEEFWALTDVSFEVPKGCTFGIVGRNGSGKSTLLQIITGVLGPTQGVVEVSGRVAALLELGAGFNPEFTGRQNVLFNGMVMGLTEEEMRGRLDEVQAFADIGRFFDQPVKTYSSGMFVRLGFAAAINVDPDILIIDEALAVGDARFQLKCFEKFIDFQRRGKTILFVTHSIEAIAKHCGGALLLEGGKVAAIGDPPYVMGCYQRLLFMGHLDPEGEEQEPVGAPPVQLADDSGSSDAAAEVFAAAASTERRACSESELALEAFLGAPGGDDRVAAYPNYNPNEYRFGDRRGIICDYMVVSRGAVQTESVYCGDWVDIYFKLHAYSEIDVPMVGISIKSVSGQTLFGQNTRHANTDMAPMAAGETVVIHYRVKFDVAPFDTFVELGFAEKLPDNDAPIDIRKNLIHFRVLETSIFEGVARLEMSYREIRSPAEASASA